MSIFKKYKPIECEKEIDEVPIVGKKYKVVIKSINDNGIIVDCVDFGKMKGFIPNSHRLYNEISSIGSIIYVIAIENISDIPNRNVFSIKLAKSQSYAMSLTLKNREVMRAEIVKVLPRHMLIKLDNKLICIVNDSRYDGLYKQVFTQGKMVEVLFKTYNLKDDKLYFDIKN